MKKIFLILAFLPSLAFAGGPKWTYPSVRGLDDEMQNIYHNISYPIINYATISSETVTYSSITTLANRTNSCGYVMGSIVQKVVTTALGAQSVTSVSFSSATNWNTAITLKCASDYVNVNWVGVVLTTVTNQGFATIWRNGVDLSNGTQGLSTFFNQANTGNGTIWPVNMFAPDVPASTGPFTYAMLTEIPTGRVLVCDGGNQVACKMILEEVAQ